jgi:subtilisin family serine protease
LFSFRWGPTAYLVDQPQAVADFPTITGAGEVIVDIDSGIDFAHPSLAGKIWTNPGEIPNNGIDDDGNGFIDDTQGWNFESNNNDPTDELGHGTQTSGIMVANPFRFEGFDYQGIAPGAKILPLMVSTDPNPSTAFDQHVGEALDYVVWMVEHHPEYHIAAVNLSLAAVSQASFAQYEQSDIETLADMGVFVSCASGNEANLTTVDYPAADPKAFAIAGENPDGTVTPVSNRGSKVALLAPGNDVPLLTTHESYILGGDGTSYAAPYITAAAVLIKQVNNSFTPAQIMSILQQSGIEVYDRASHRTYRRLDLQAAIALALEESGPQSTAFLGVPAKAPGLIQAENFDQGGEGIAYHDTDPTNDGGRYRTGDGVDIERCFEGGYDVTDTFAGEWMRYTINVTAGGTYAVSFRVAAKRTGGTFHLDLDGLNVTGELQVPRTGAAQSYATISKTGIYLSSGPHVLELMVDSNSASGASGNFNWFEFTSTVPRGAQGASAAIASPATPNMAPSIAMTTEPTSWLADSIATF